MSMESIPAQLTRRTLNSLRGKWLYCAAKKGELLGKIISPSIFGARCPSLEQTVVVVESYNIATMTLYIRLSLAVQTDF